MGLCAFSSAIAAESVITDRREPECWAELWVALDRLFQPSQRCPNAPVIPG